MAASLAPDALSLDDTVVFESGQVAGQLSVGRAGRLANGILGAGVDVQAVIAYMNLAPATATLAQVQAGTQAFMRVIHRMLT